MDSLKQSAKATISFWWTKSILIVPNISKQVFSAGPLSSVQPHRCFVSINVNVSKRFSKILCATCAAGFVSNVPLFEDHVSDKTFLLVKSVRFYPNENLLMQKVTRASAKIIIKLFIQDAANNFL